MHTVWSKNYRLSEHRHDGAATDAETMLEANNLAKAKLSGMSRESRRNSRRYGVG